MAVQNGGMTMYNRVILMSNFEEILSDGEVPF